MARYETLSGGRAEIRLHLDPDLLATVESGVYDQARNTANVADVQQVSILPDTHTGYGAPVGSVVVTRDRVIPGPVGFDIGCGMAVYLTSLQAEDIRDKATRRALMDAICSKVAMGEGQDALHGLRLDEPFIMDVLNHGAYALSAKGIIPREWLARCERPVHEIPPGGPADTSNFTRYEVPLASVRGFKQLGTLGGGNHFLELQEIRLSEDPVMRALGERWRLRDGQLVIMIHSGSRGLGHAMGQWAFEQFKAYNDEQGEFYPDRELVHAPVDSKLGNQYLRYVAAGGNFALANRLMMAAVVKGAIKEAFPDVAVDLLYEISHNLAQWEPLGGENVLVHRKGTTRALPAGHPLLAGTLWEATGHPVITPGSMGDISAIQVGLPGAEASAFSINHGAGRRMSRSKANKELDQATVDADLAEKDVLINHRNAPLDEAPAAYKPLADVLRAVRYCGLADVVATCRPLAAMKGGASGHRKRGR